MKRSWLNRKTPLRAKPRNALNRVKIARRASKGSKSVSTLKKELDRVYSIYIRRKYADANGFAECFTCGVRKHWKELQNGHYVSRAHNNTRFDDFNCHVQCAGCNIFKSGNMDMYAIRLREKYGEGILEELNRRKNVIKQFTAPELEKLIAQYKLAVGEHD